MGVVQFKGTGVALSVTLDAAVSSGSRLIAACATYGPNRMGTTGVVSNSAPGASDTWVRDVVTDAAGVTTQVAFFRCDAPTAGVTQVNIAAVNGGAGSQVLAVWEVNDFATGAFDKSGTQGASSTSTPATSSTGTLTQATERAFALVVTDQGNTDTITPTAGESWTQSGEFEDGTTGYTFNAVYKDVAATTALSASWTLAGSHTTSAEIATYKVTAGTTATPGVIATPAVLPAPALIVSSTATPGVLATPVTLPSVVAGQLVTATPAVLATPVALPGIALTAASTTVGYVKEVGFVTDTTSGTTSAITVATGGVPAGDTIVIIGACDNTGSSGAVQTITAADNSSQPGTANTWTTQTPHGIADPGAASAGQEGFMIVCVVTRPLLAGDTITVTYANSTTAKAINAQQFHGVNRTTPVLTGTYAHTDNETSTTCSVATTPTAAGQCVVAGTCVEGGTADSFTADSDTTNGSWVQLTRRGSGTTTSGSTLNSGYKIVTASGAQTWNPTLGTARDHCEVALTLDVISVTDVLIQMPVLATPAVLPAPTVTTPAPSPQPGVIATPAVLPAPTIVISATVTPAVLATPVALPAPVIAVGPTMAVLATPVALPAPTITVSRTATPGVIATPVVLPYAAPPTPFPYPASISGRKVLDQDGNVFLLRTFSSWGMPERLSNTDITTALEGVAGNGFNAVTIDMCGSMDHGTGWNRYHNIAGDPFWTGTPFQSSLGSAWATVDHIVSECARLGMCVVMSLFGGFGDGSTSTEEGGKYDWRQATDTQMHDAGVAIATRYASAINLIWHLELDRGDTPGSQAGTRAEAFFDGINDTEGASTRPFRWMEPEVNGTANDLGWVGTTSLQAINTGYNYTMSSTEAVEGWYADVTTVPFGDAEPPYDASSHFTGTVGQQLRERSYAVFLEGGCVINYGHEDWWPFGGQGVGSTESLAWTDVQAHSHTVHQGYCWSLLDTFVADTAWDATSAFLTTGAGSGDTKAAVGASPRAAIVYFPNSRTIVVDTTILSGTGNVRLRWYDPTTGTFSTIAASEAQNASRSVTYAGNNAAGESDQVLVVDLLETLVSPVVLTTPVALPPVTIRVDRTATPAVVATPVTLPAPTVSLSRIATPAVLATPVTLPAPTVIASVTVAPGVVATPVGLPGAAPRADVTVTPAIVTTPVGLPAPTITVDRTATPTIVVTPVTLPTPVITVDRTATPVVVTTPVALPAPSVSAGGSSTAQGPLVATPVTMPTPTVRVDETATQGLLLTPAALPAPTITVDRTAILATISTPVVLPTPTITTGSGATATPTVVGTPVALPSVSVSTTSGVTVNAAVVPTPVALPGVILVVTGVAKPNVIATPIALPGAGIVTTFLDDNPVRLVYRETGGRLGYIESSTHLRYQEGT